MINEYRVEKFCCEDIRNIENYEKAIADTTQMWHCHHRRECVDGVFTSRKDLIANGLYYNRPANELIFLTRTAHRSLHCKDPNVWMKLIKGRDRLETKQKIRESLNRPDVKKKISESTKRALNDPAIKQKHLDAMRRPEYIQKQRNAKLGKRWYTDGVHCKLAFECPGEGWHFGKIHHKRS